jgi:hypothetical protein
MEASDGITDGGWTLVTTRDSGTATEVLTEGSLSPDLRQRAVTTLQWQYLFSKSSQLLIKMRGTAAAVDVVEGTGESCTDCAYEELTMVMDTSTLASYSCKSINSVLSLAEPLLSRDSNAACDATGTRYTDILGSPEEDVASQNIIRFVGAAATCAETATGDDAVAEDASACTAVTDLGSSTACEAVLTKVSDDSQDDSSSAVADAAACTFTASSADVTLPGSCAHLSAAFPFLPSGHYYIRPSNEIAAFQVYCDMSTLNGGWTLLLTREYGYPTTLAGGVDLSTPRTGLLSTHYQAIKASNFEGACCL